MSTSSSSFYFYCETCWQHEDYDLLDFAWPAARGHFYRFKGHRVLFGNGTTVDYLDEENTKRTAEELRKMGVGR